MSEEYEAISVNTHTMPLTSEQCLNLHLAESDWICVEKAAVFYYLLMF